MKIKWYGHSCFLLTDSNGSTVLTDPCDPSYGYEIPPMHADIVTISHEHNEIIRSPGEYNVKGIHITGVETLHDRSGGALRGKNTMFIYDIDDMRILHCGDLGMIPDEETIAKVGHIDIMLVPIGAIKPRSLNLSFARWHPSLMRQRTAAFTTLTIVKQQLQR